MTITAAQYRQMEKPEKRSKYRNKKTVRDGITFDSIAEANFYSELKLMERAGEVCEVQLQPPFKIVIDGMLICTYKADFMFWDCVEKRTRVVDVKGFPTPEFKLKRKLMKAVNRIDVEVITAKGKAVKPSPC